MCWVTYKMVMITFHLNAALYERFSGPSSMQGFCSMASIILLLTLDAAVIWQPTNHHIMMHAEAAESHHQQLATLVVDPGSNLSRGALISHKDCGGDGGAINRNVGQETVALNARDNKSTLTSPPQLSKEVVDSIQSISDPDYGRQKMQTAARLRRRKQVASARRHLRAINKPAVKHIQSSDGDIIDCVELDKQPALDHPLLKNHIIETFPSSLPRAMTSSFMDGKYTTSWQRMSRHPSPALPQLWHRNGSCPLGTIPVRRTSLEDVVRTTGNSQHQKYTGSDPPLYGRKTHKPARFQRRDQNDPFASVHTDDDTTTSISHEHAIAFTEASELYGAKAVLSVWNPWVEASNEFSLSQVWILGGSFDGDLNSIEAGWQVSPELYGDNRPRLFIYWTTDAYEATGCYNLLCSGFIQTSNNVAIGASIAPVSSFGGNQYQIEIMIWKDPRQGNWWMAFEGSHIVGYWPASLFSHLSSHANMVEWGGEVVNSNPSGHHTGTQMGSGKFAEGGFGTASFFHSLQVVDSDNSLQPVTYLQTLAEHPNCYDIRSLQDPNWGASFYYGGPGRNSLCL